MNKFNLILEVPEQDQVAANRVLSVGLFEVGFFDTWNDAHSTGLSLLGRPVSAALFTLLNAGREPMEHTARLDFHLRSRICSFTIEVYDTEGRGTMYVMTTASRIIGLRDAVSC